MGNDLVMIEDGSEALSLAVLPPPAALDRNPAAVYLASLPSPESRRTLGATLEGLAGLLSGGTAGALCDTPAPFFSYASFSFECRVDRTHQHR